MDRLATPAMRHDDDDDGVRPSAGEGQRLSSSPRVEIRPETRARGGHPDVSDARRRDGGGGGGRL